MAIVIKPITVEVSKPNVFQAIAAKQNDSNSRFLKVTFVNEGEKIEVPPSAKVTINAERNDGQSNSFFGEVNADGTVTVPIHSWILELPGIVESDISIIEEDSKLTCTTFTLLVEEASHSSGDISDSEQYDVLTDLINEVKGLGGSGGGGSGVAGENGATFTPSVSTDGVISWTNDKGLENPPPVNIKGEKGDKGDQGIQGIQGIQGERGLQGEQGIQGEKGADGAKGDKGDKGDTGANGKDGVNGYTPQKGIDYYTEADKAEIVTAVIEAIGGNPVFGYVDENNNIIVQGNLAEGSYNVKYEMEGGSTIDIGELVIDNNVYYSVANNLTNCTNGNSAIEVIEGNSYSATISANSGYELKSVVVTMGGQSVSVSGGTINIASVTGNIVITAVAEEIATSGYTNLANPNDPYWKEGYKLSVSSGGTSALAGHTSTNFIPVKAEDVLRVKGMKITVSGGGVSNSCKIVEYSEKDVESSKLGGMFGGTSMSAKTDYGKKVSVNGDVSEYTLFYDNLGTQVMNTNTKYIRIDGELIDGYTKDDVIITINEEIV